MIIYGWRHFSATKAQGNFHCPACNAERVYHLKSTRQWFTLYFIIPVFPISGLTEYIECAGCRGTFLPEVIHFDPTTERTRATADIRLMLVLLLKECGRTTEDDLRRLSAIFSALFGAEAPVNQLQTDLNHARQAGPAAFQQFAGRLATCTTEAKLLLLTCAAQVLGSDNAVHPQDREKLVSLSLGMQLNPAMLDTVLQQSGKAG